MLFAGGLFAAYLAFSSQLALAQSADSVLDVVGALVLAMAVGVAAMPSDERHPGGHSSAEPLAALAVAMLAAVLAVQVGEEAVTALRTGSTVHAAGALIGAFAVKGAFKLGLLAWISSTGVRAMNPAAGALFVDARNDVLLTLASIVGALAARYGWAQADAWLALPIAGWIGWSGLELGRENVSFLMGAAPPAERMIELRRLAEAVPGVRGVHAPRIHYLGTLIQVHLHIEVDPELTIAGAHDIGEEVRRVIESEGDVGHCSVHIDVTKDE